MRHLVIYSIIVAWLLFLSIVSARPEQLSTVFVLETADSPESASSSHSGEEASAPVIKVKSLDDPNTRIITDSGPSSSSTATTSPSNKQQKPASSSNNSFKISIINQQHDQQTPSSSTSNESNNPQRRSSYPSATQSDESIHLEESRNREIANARRIEDEAQLVSAKANTATRSTNTNNNQQAPSQRPRSTSTTTAASPYDHDDTHSHHSISTPKVEERLLISITSEDDDNNYKPPHKNSGSSVNGQSDELGPTHQQQQQGHQLQKRKPSITISIQDANINKQNGGSGPSAVIVRPGEDGQSIVIATVGASNNNNHNIHNNNNQDNKYVNQRPPVSSGFNGNSNNHNNNNHLLVTEAPYREPINNPIQSIINQHIPTSTTRRPLVNTDYNPSINSPRPPITSSLVEPQRPSSQVSDERPPRPPIVGGLEQDSSNYESSQSRPTSRPITRPPPPPSQDSYSFNNNNNNNNNQDYQDTSRPVSESGGSTGLSTLGGESKFPLNEKNCGLVHETRIVGGEEADPDDFLWMAAIIKSRPKEGEARPFCGGSLITRRHILTAAHCLEGLAPRDVLVRLGSYDFDDSTASSLSADFAIDQFRVPAQYSKKTHMADIAIMRLKTPLQMTDNYKTVCMPQPRRSYVGALGTVTGYGSQSQTFRRAAPKLRQVTVPIWENRKCSVVYKKNLTESFLCAGYEEGGKDACQGDSGGPLMTEGPNERMMIVGVVSHGIGCGSPGYPGVYTRTTTFLDWIEKNTRE